MRVCRAAVIWTLLAFVLGVAVGPVLGTDHKTETINVLRYGPSGTAGQIINSTSRGWIVTRTDRVTSAGFTPATREAGDDVLIISFERPRIVSAVAWLQDVGNAVIRQRS